MKPNVDVPGFRRTDPGFFSARYGLGDEVGKVFGNEASFSFGYG